MPFTIEFEQSGWVIYRNVVTEEIVPAGPAAGAGQFEIDPPLPHGLTIEPTTGIIRGLPTQRSESTTYTVRAQAPSGEGQGRLSLRIVDPPRFVLVSNEGDSTFSTFSIDPSTGMLGHRSFFAAPPDQRKPREILLHPSGEFMFSVNFASGSISAYGANATEGLLAAGGVAGAGTEPNTMAMNAAGTYLYVGDLGSNEIHTYVFDQAVGSLTEVGSPVSTGAVVAGIVVHPNDRWIYLTSRDESRIETYAIDPSNGTPSFVRATLINSTPSGLAIDASGRNIYFLSENFQLIAHCKIDPETGILSDHRTKPTEAGPRQIALHPSGRFLYVSNELSGSITKYVINEETGGLSQPVIIPADARPQRVSFDPAGHFAYVANAESETLDIYRVDPGNGDLSTLGKMRTRDKPGFVVMLTGERPAVRVAKYAYVTASGVDEVASFAVEPESGVLSPIGSSAIAGDAPTAIAVDPRRRFAFVCNRDSNDVTTFTIRPGDGLLLQAGAATPCGASPTDIIVDPSARFVYAASYDDGTILAFSFDGATGLLGPIDLEVTSNPHPTSLTIDPTGQNLYVANEGVPGDPNFPGDVTVFRIHPVDGTLNAIQSGAAAGGRPSSIEFDRTGLFLYATKRSADTLISASVILPGGTLTPQVLSSALMREPTDVAISPDGRFLYAALFGASDPGVVASFTVDALSGSLTANGTLVDGVNPLRVVPHPDGRLLYVVNYGSGDVSLLEVDGESGALSLAGAATWTGPQPTSLALVEVDD